MIYRSSTRQEHLMPRHDIDPSLKVQAEWHREVAKYVYGYDTGSWLASRRREFETLRRYAANNQDTQQYKSRFYGDDQNVNTSQTGDSRGPTGSNNEFYDLANHRVGLGNIDFEKIFSPAANMVATLRGIMQSKRHAIRATAIDQASNSAKKDMEYTIQCKMKFKDLFDTFAAVIGDERQPLPKDAEELGLYSALGGFTLPYETGIQELIDHTYRQDSIEETLSDRIIEDFISIGMSASIDEVDMISQKAKIRYADMDNLIIQYNEDSRNFTDITFWGEQRYVTIYEIRSKTGWDEERIWKLANMFNGNKIIDNPIITLDKNTKYGETGMCNYNDIRIPVLYYEFLSVDSRYYTDVDSETAGKFRVAEPYRNGGRKAPKIYDKEKRKTTSHDVHTWYCGYWVMDTDDVYCFGKKLDQPYDTRVRQPRCSLHAHVLPGPSLIKQVMPILDDIQMLYLRYQNDIATAPPANGIAVELSSLNELKIGNKKLHPMDTIKIRNRAGILFYNLHSAPLPGEMQKFNNVVPFQDLPGGIGMAIKDFVSGTTNAYQQLAVISGVDRFTLNSINPTSEQTATQIKMAVSNTKDSIRPIYSGWLRIKESIARSIAIQCQQLIVNNSEEDCPYKGVISDAKLIAIRMAGSTPPAEYGIEIFAMPSEDEIAKIEQAAMAATAGGKNGIPALTFSEYLWIVDRLKVGTPIQHILAFINYKEKMRDEQAAQMAAQAQEMDTKKGIAVNAAKSEAEAIKIKLESEEKQKQILAQGLVDIMVAQKATVEELKLKAVEMGFAAGKEAFNAQQQPGMNSEQMPQEMPQGPMPEPQMPPMQ